MLVSCPVLGRTDSSAFSFSPGVLTRHEKMPMMTRSVASDGGGDGGVNLCGRLGTGTGMGKVCVC